MSSPGSVSITQEDTATPGEVKQPLLSFQRDGLGRNLRPEYLRKRHRTLVAFFMWLEREGRLTTLDAITSQDVAAYLAYRKESGAKPGTVKGNYLVLHAWFSWLENEEEIAVSPMRKMHAPKIPEQPPDILTDDAVKALLKTCAGNSFRDRQANALIRLLLDTGLRASEQRRFSGSILTGTTAPS